MNIYAVTVAIEIEPHTKKVETVRVVADCKPDAIKMARTELVQYKNNKIKVLNIVNEGS